MQLQGMGNENPSAPPKLLLADGLGVGFRMCVVHGGGSGRAENAQKDRLSHSVPQGTDQTKIRILIGECSLLKI